MKQITWVALGWLALTATAQAASFNCAKATSKIEKLICGNSELSKLDERLGTVYLQVINQNLDKNDVIQGQRHWLKTVRNDCEDIGCLTTAYKDRISVLAALISSKEARPASVDSHNEHGRNLIVGDWDSGSRIFEGLKLTVQDKVVTIGSCEKVPYVLIKDHDGHGPNTTPSNSKEKWREIVIELTPINANQIKCVGDSFRVLDFSIPEDNECHADIAMFRSRKDFESSSGWAWGVWGNNDCTSTE